MSRTARAAWAVAFTALVAGAANAQSQTAAPSAPQPSDPMGLSYQSALDGYQRFTDEKVGSWREANDNVGRIGGWREYAREARDGAAPAASPAPAAAPASPGAAPASRDPHAGHGTR